jgi:hypothetical protein
VKRIIIFGCIALLGSSFAWSAERGNANNPNAVLVVTEVFGLLPEFPPEWGIHFAFCAMAVPGKRNLDTAYGSPGAQGDEGINIAADTRLCVSNADGTVIYNPDIFDWPTEGCTDEGTLWDADPLPHEEGCP